MAEHNNAGAADFADYMDGVAKAEEAARRREEMLAAHEVSVYQKYCTYRILP
jgi:hypothetical protein